MEMYQSTFFEPTYWSVSELTLYIRELIESDNKLQDLWVKGEISNLSIPRSGHLYFSLKDSSSSLRCVMWRNAVQRLDFNPRDGQAVGLHGAINIYEVQGQYQLYVDTIRPYGEGTLYQEFQRLKAQLEGEGLFDSELKQPIPVAPRKIGIVTSATGAAIRDILKTIERRYPILKVILAPSVVQGADAPSSIVNALDLINRQIAPDVIILARGGGSIEDLWAFNDERVARAISKSIAPVITGIGHETDFTIADFVADLRAPTPTAAAELATPNKEELFSKLAEIGTHFSSILRQKFVTNRQELKYIESRLAILSPIRSIHTNRQRLDDISNRFSITMQQFIHLRRVQLSGTDKYLSSLDPSAVLGRGYAALTKDGMLIKSISQVELHDFVNAALVDGQLGMSIEQIVNTQDDKELPR